MTIIIYEYNGIRTHRDVEEIRRNSEYLMIEFKNGQTFRYEFHQWFKIEIINNE